MAYTKKAKRFLIDFRSLERRIYRIQFMYKSDMSVKEMVDKHAQNAAKHMNPFGYFHNRKYYR
ncbi:hypothetical protein FM042_06875 [Aliidiomarina halalkaliphila]|uniref:Uncharacterized protein n=1 Tax=Aliidiomarina halalkaliphila TaxID=2593535 RepID=A0A552X108_9GAMM|nr:hypothetical protein [Aliidiomarina halalkaliphila]TRW48704.1 hypothetical protein FM042_06875 [Aliidiomarina halalkaliphila]